MKGIEVSIVDIWFSRLSYYFFGVLGVGFLWILNFDVEGKEYEYLIEMFNIIKGVFDFVKEDNYDVVIVSNVIYEDYESNEEIKIVDVLKKRRNDDVGEFMIEVGWREVNILERIVIRNSKCVKFEDFSRGGEF